ncbi:Histidinol-phosphate aminotransferase 2 [compost metagenome]
MADQEFVADCRTKNREGIAYLYGEFERLGLTYFPAHGNFIMVDVQRPAGEMFGSLLQLGIIVRAGFSKYPNFVRVTVGSAEQNAKFVTALEQVLGKSATRV